MVLPQPGRARSGLPGGLSVNIFRQLKYSIFAQFFYKQFVKNVVSLCLRPLPERRAEARPCARTGDAAYRPSSGSVLPFLLRMGVQGAVESAVRGRRQKSMRPGEKQTPGTAGKDGPGRGRVIPPSRSWPDCGVYPRRSRAARSCNRQTAAAVQSAAAA